MSYQIKIEGFEGPFDLLLNLIMKQRLDIYDVPIAEITEQYLSYVEQLQTVNLETASEFLLVAATLVEMKSANLLPGKVEYFEEDEISPKEARQNLVARLVEYKKFKNASLSLATRLESESRYYKREVGPEEKFLKLLPDFLKDVSIDDLADAIIKLLVKKNALIIDTSHVIPTSIDIKKIFSTAADKLRRTKNQTFRELTADCKNKAEIVAYFLVILEFYKNSLLKINQAENFGEIEMKFCESSMPENNGGGLWSLT
ncbi:segregation/condensation protein A [Candidatus Oleimmundimicrobium sp.]|uniref:segregation and condensation protein A n=1 Tax=Candidatus Oleimmundimicrobium sp. TaxID=3060597 RepID=UPI00271A65F1|nr:segregation/condensation protein A [Candidatus Oleimmundimicrobium sp.]MDO8886102.1 segregation/condensation protein A [Candidatus Oleimmundimicrobium sp.]